MICLGNLTIRDKDLSPSSWGSWKEVWTDWTVERAHSPRTAK